MRFRTGGDSFGTHRALDPVGSLPQAAHVLDASLPLFDNEILVSVTRLQIDAASFNQLQKDSPNSPASFAKGVLPTETEQTPLTVKGGACADKILSIVSKRGKMHNPVTDSGGVFLGKVAEVGPKHPGNFKVGDEVVSLVSLSLTPLHLMEVKEVDEVAGQVAVCGHAIVFESGLMALIPSDMNKKVVMAALDVCGAPAQVKRLVLPGQSVLLIGLGKAGRSMAVMAQKLGARVFGVDANPEAVDWCHEHVSGLFATMSSDDPIAIYRWVKEVTRGELAPVVIHSATSNGSEMSAILPCRDKGVVLYFGMNTSFQKATLGAEGVGKDIQLVMGNGYVPGHAALMLNLLKEHSGLRTWFERKYG